MARLEIEKGTRASKHRVLCDGKPVENAAFLAERPDHYLVSVSKAKPPVREGVETATEPPYETRGARRMRGEREENEER